MTIRSPKKLIEVALPLDAINEASAREKSIRHGHPSTLHLWWARRPLAAARAVIFAQMVNDPGGERGYYAGKTRAQADAEREELFQILRELVQWENTNNPEVLARARAAIAKSWRETCELNKGKPGFEPERLPAFHDPFAGGGALPLEAQRLGLESYASDLNPVAVTINKAMIEIPPRFAGRAPVGPAIEAERGTVKANRNAFEDWSGARGLAEDVRRYGAWMREEAHKRIGHLYPQVEVTAEMAAQRPDLKPLVGQKLTVIAWLWARTVKSPNPAFSHVEVPLASTFILSSKAGKEAYVQPVVERDGYRFEVRLGTPPEGAKNGTKLARANFACVLSGTPVPGDYIKAEGKAGRMGARLMAIVAEGLSGRVYLAPTVEHEAVVQQASPTWKPAGDIPTRMTGGNCTPYGLTTWGDLFTPRQLVALTTFSDLVPEAIARVKADALAAGMPDDGLGLEADGQGATAYAEAIGVYLSFCSSRMADRHSSLCRWDPNPSGYAPKIANTFGRQALPMVWDYVEGNPFSPSSGNYADAMGWICKVMDYALSATAPGTAQQDDAQTQFNSANKLISTDPPYYDNIGYADLSDFFYVWLRRSLRPIFPSLYATLAVPKAEELVATPYRHGSKQKAETFFLDGMTAAMRNLAQQAHPAFPVTIYYAFKQSDTSNDTGTHSTGWETFLEAVLRAGFTLTGTWPMRTELGNRMIGSGTNALASSIVLVCRQRDAQAETISRRDFQRLLREQLPEALETMIGGASGQSPIAPVDLAQAAIGPGMGIYSQYAAVLNQDGSPMSVHDALILINREITDFLTPDAGSFDADTLFANGWFEQYGWAEGPFGEAQVLAQGKGTTVDGVAKAGVVQSGGGKVRLLRWADYPTEWDPRSDSRAPVWEATHQLIRALNTQGESAAGELLAAMPDKAEPIRQLAYHLYTLCERKKWAEDARAYNELITAWHAVVAASIEAGQSGSQLALEV
jgi:putative DNA methylase